MSAFRGPSELLEAVDDSDEEGSPSRQRVRAGPLLGEAGSFGGRRRFLLQLALELPEFEPQCFFIFMAMRRASVSAVVKDRRRTPWTSSSLESEGRGTNTDLQELRLPRAVRCPRFRPRELPPRARMCRD